MENTKQVLDSKAMIVDANKQNEKIAEMLTKADQIIATNDLKQINTYLSELKEAGGMLPKTKLKKIADNLSVNMTDDLGDIAFFVKNYGEFGAISSKLIKRIMIQYNKASEAEFMTYFADMVSGMSDSDLDKLIAETKGNPKLNAICQRIKKRRMATQAVHDIEMHNLQTFEAPKIKRITQKKATKQDEQANVKTMRR